MFSWYTHHAGNYNAYQNIIILKYIVRNIIPRDRSRSTLRYLFVDAACLSLLPFFGWQLVSFLFYLYSAVRRRMRICKAPPLLGARCRI